MYYFYPRSPCGERRDKKVKNTSTSLFLSTLSLRRATRGAVICYLDNIISIHALLAESDTSTHQKQQGQRISIHALLAESDLGNVVAGLHMSNFYPRSPCGERPWAVFFNCNYPLISIHALLAESDERAEHHANSQQEFLSTLSLRRATRRTYQQGEKQAFLSTLSLRRATILCVVSVQIGGFLSTLSLRRATTCIRDTAL